MSNFSQMWWPLLLLLPLWSITRQGNETVVSEAWHSITEQHIKDLEVMDRMLLQYILGAHSIKHSEFLYLETGATPLKQVITCRRIIYLHTILKRPATELTHKVYKAQQESPVKGDWVQ